MGDTVSRIASHFRVSGDRRRHALISPALVDSRHDNRQPVIRLGRVRTTVQRGPRGGRVVRRRNAGSRSHSEPMLATLIRVAAERSPTFRALVAVIDATDGIVYVSAGRCDRVRACLLHRIAGTGSRRVLTIVVDTKRDEVSVMAAIAHELQHAAEVLTNVAIKTDEEMFAFYRFQSRRVRGVLETETAVQVGRVLLPEPSLEWSAGHTRDEQV